MSDERGEHGDWSWFGGGRRPWMPGIILILIGTIFLLRNLTGFELENWWALFILIPALGNFTRAVGLYRSSGQIDRGVRARLFWGLLLTTLSISFLLNLDVGFFWPVFVILAGLGLLLGAL
ncbi:MAG: hypothetical protein ACRDFQ_06575 [Anaerolineales bacterium]